MKRKILILGNSHINAFRRCFGGMFKDQGLDASVEYVMANLLQHDWTDFASNAYLRYLQYQDGLGQDMDLRGNRESIDLVLVGMGFLGTGILLPYGEVLSIPREDDENTGAYTPRLPLLPGLAPGVRPAHTTGLITEEAAGEIYRRFYTVQLSRVQQLMKESRFNGIYWIAEPDMIESAARIRFGEDMLESGLYEYHRRLAREVVGDLIEEQGLQDSIILHTGTHNRPSGFIDDAYRASIHPYDLHVKPDYYRDSCTVLMQRLAHGRQQRPHWLAKFKPLTRKRSSNDE